MDIVTPLREEPGINANIWKKPINKASLTFMLERVLEELPILSAWNKINANNKLPIPIVINRRSIEIFVCIIKNPITNTGRHPTIKHLTRFASSYCFLSSISLKLFPNRLAKLESIVLDSLKT